MDKTAALRNNIRRLRFDRGEMTQQQLADGIGVTRQTIVALESGNYNPSLLLAMQIARFFGVAVEGVFEFVDEKRKME